MGDQPFQMPPSMRCGVSIYIISDATGGTTVIECSGAKQFNPAGFDGLMEIAIEVGNKFFGTTDARGMTEQEISDYIREQGEDEDGEG